MHSNFDVLQELPLTLSFQITAYFKDPSGASSGLTFGKHHTALCGLYLTRMAVLEVQARQHSGRQGALNVIYLSINL